MKVILFIPEERQLLNSLLNSRLTVVSKLIFRSKHSTQLYFLSVSSALDKISGADTPVLSRFEKIACNSCVNEYLHGEENLSTIQMTLSKNILSKCGYYKKQKY
jgi:hypothetical protein